MKLPLTLLTIAILFTTSTFAFEGMIRQVTKNHNKTGVEYTFDWYISSTKIRLDNKSKAPDGKETHSVTIIDLSRKAMDMYYLVPTPPFKSYLEVLVNEVRGELTNMTAHPTHDKMKLLGKNCEKWEVSASGFSNVEWISRDIDMDWTAFAPYFKTSPIIQIMVQHGIHGFPMQTDSPNEPGSVIVTAIEPRAIPASTFEIPAGYQVSRPDPEVMPAGKK